MKEKYLERFLEFFLKYWVEGGVIYLWREDWRRNRWRVFFVNYELGLVFRFLVWMILKGIISLGGGFIEKGKFLLKKNRESVIWDIL